MATSSLTYARATDIADAWTQTPRDATTSVVAADTHPLDPPASHLALEVLFLFLLFLRVLNHHHDLPGSASQFNGS
jgi:hypothetical protein